MEIFNPVVITAFVSGVLGPISVLLVKNIIEKNKDKDPVKHALNHHKLIAEQLDILVDELNCDRVWISQFHNGGHFYPTGKSIQKFSLTFESVSPGMSSLSDTYYNIPVSLFTHTLNQLHEKHEILIPDIKKDGTHGIKGLCEDNYVNSIYVFGMFNLKNYFIGFMVVEYKKKTILSEDKINHLRQKSTAIATVINKFLYSK
jgi:hypothetical protein